MNLNRKVRISSCDDNNESDPWNELKSIVYIARLVGQGPGGTFITTYTILVAITEAIIALNEVLSESECFQNTMSYVTEGGQVLIMYLTASWCGLMSAVKRRDQDIFNIIKKMPCKMQYKATKAYRAILYKLILLVPFILFNPIFSTEIGYKSKWTFTSFYLPLIQLVVAQLQMTTVLDILTRNMNNLTDKLPTCLGLTETMEYKYRSNLDQVKILPKSMEDCSISSSHIFTVSNSSLRRNMLNSLIMGHEQLQEAAILVSSTFGLQTLISLGRTFLVITFNAFLFIVTELFYHINHGEITLLFQHSFSMVTIVIIHLAELWSLVSSADSFSRSSEKFTRNLFIAAIEDDTEILAEMDIVKNHIASRRDNTITAFGFIAVNYPLICYMMGAVTTYIVIISQIGSVE